MQAKTTNTNFILTALFLAVLVDMLGVGIVIAVLVDYIKESPRLLANFTIGKSEEQIQVIENLVYLSLISTFALSQFFGSSMLGSLSDVRGRKKVVIASMFGGAFGYFIFGLGVVQSAVFVLFIGRVITGFFSGSVSILYSMVADISSPENKAKNFGVVGAAFALGFIIGPLFGSFLADDTISKYFSYSTPFFTTMALSLLSGIMIHFFVPETYQPKANAKSNLNPFQGLRKIGLALQSPKMRTILTILFLVYFGFTFFTQYSAVYLKDKMGIDKTQIGYYYGFIGLVLFITQMGVNRVLSKYFSPRSILRVVLLTMPLGMSLFLIPNQFKNVFFVVYFMPISFGLFQPNLLSIISNSASKDIQGEILGIQQSVRSLAYIFPPLVAAGLRAIPSHYIPNFIRQIDLPVQTGVFIVLIAWCIVFVNYKRLGDKNEPKSI